MELRRVLSLVRKACDDYEMIAEGDRIAVGISGGKDSLTLLYALAELRRFYPHRFELFAVTVDLGWEGFDLSPIQNFCDAHDVSYHIVKTDIYDVVFNVRKESNPCSLCAKMRKGALNAYLVENNIRKIAYAHHMDDVVDTMMMSLIFEGRINTFSPVTFLDRMGVTVIRPLLYMNESDVVGFTNKYDLPVVKSPCPVDKYTQREYAKELVLSINRDHPGAKDRMFTAIKNSSLKGWNKNGESK